MVSSKSQGNIPLSILYDQVKSIVKSWVEQKSFDDSEFYL